MTPLKKKQRQFENPGLPSLEFKFSPTLWRGATRSELFLIYPRLGLLSDDNPSSTLRTCDARTRNAVGHTQIIWCPTVAFAASHATTTIPHLRIVLAKSGTQKNNGVQEGERVDRPSRRISLEEIVNCTIHGVASS